MRLRVHKILWIFLGLFSILAFQNCTGTSFRLTDESFLQAASLSSSAGSRLNLSLVLPKVSNAPSLTQGGSYNYAPSIIFEDGKYRMYWCAGVLGDTIAYAEASSLDGPWSSNSGADPFGYALVATQGAQDFDGTLVCDPSVLHVNGKYYLWYGAGSDTKPVLSAYTTMGVAVSEDGIHFQRLNSGKLIMEAREYVNPSNFLSANQTSYGLGQPTVIYLQNQFYMLYTDTTGLNGGATYVRRSADPTFQKGVEDRIVIDGVAQFVPSTPDTFSRDPLVTDGASLDWMYSDQLHAFIVCRYAGNGYTIRLYDSTLSNVIGETEILGSVAEGGGLVRGPDGHAIGTGTSGEIQIGIMRALSNGTLNPVDPGTWTGLGPMQAVLKIAPGSTSFFTDQPASLNPGTPHQEVGAYNFITVNSNSILSSDHAPSVLQTGEDVGQGLYYSSLISSVAQAASAPSINTLTPFLRTYSSLYLNGRTVNGQILGFPQKIDLYMTNTTNSGWDFVGSFDTVADAQGNLKIPLSLAHQTYGFLIYATIMGPVSTGQFAFQLTGLSAD